MAFLDDDNEYEPDHVRHLARHLVGSGVGWAHSLRKIVRRDGSFVCDDNCESLGGLYRTVCGPGDYLVDTSCYMLERGLAIKCAEAWNVRARDPSGAPEADRALCRALLSSAPHAVVRRHTVRYRLGSQDWSVKERFFLDGNAAFGYDFAAKPDIYVFHLSREATGRYLAGRRHGGARALDEWQMTTLDALNERYNLLNGYEVTPNLPPGAAVLVTMCMPHEVPWKLLEERRDLWRVGYTAEGPNIRHAAQWDPELLAKHFDALLTYWKPLLEDPRVPTVFCPHNTHHLRLPRDEGVLRANEAGDVPSVAMVLERRRGLVGTYAVPNMPKAVLRCLDPLRPAFVKDLDHATVYGVGWDEEPLGPGVTVGHALHRSRDPNHAVDILKQYSYALIVENCDAEWYASEKIYDALIAGCVPLYYGSLPPALGVPEGPEDGVYLDLRARFGHLPQDAMSGALQEWLDALPPGALAAWKARVAERRAGILAKVGADAFADAVDAALAMRPEHALLG